MKTAAWLIAILALGCCTRGKAPESADPRAMDKTTIVAVVNGEPVTAGDLNASLNADYRRKEQELFDLKRETLEQLIVRKLVVTEAQKNGISEGEFLKQRVGTKVLA